MLRPAVLFIAAYASSTTARPTNQDPPGQVLVSSGTRWAPCAQEPQVGDRVLVHSVDPQDEGSCVQTYLHQTGEVQNVDASTQPYLVGFGTPSCADVCRSNDCGSDCSVGDTTCGAAGEPGNGCNGCGASVQCSADGATGTCYFRKTEVWCVGDTPPPPPSPPPSQTCDVDDDCEHGSYCDSSNHCYSCDYISPGQCDDESGNCCTDVFLSQCPGDPYGCGPTPGSRCDLSTCECDGVSLSSLRGKTHHAPADAEGYAYMLSVCGEIPKDELPSGCQQYAEHPAVVKYKSDNPADCIEIGSVGPCSQGECGVTGTAQPHGGLELVYTYTYGCKNTFSLMMTPGTDSEPGQILSDECSYSGAWAGLADGMDQYRCEHDRCVKSGRHLPGVEKAACETICGEPPRCVAALDRLCGDTQDQTSCEFCAGSHDIQLALAGCKHEEISTFCAATDQ